MGQTTSGGRVETSKRTEVEYDEHLKNLIANNRILIFSKTKCSYCTRAKHLLDDLNLAYKSIELDVPAHCPRNDCTPLVKSLVGLTRIQTVPQIFINGECIGGYDDLDTLVHNKNKTTFDEILNKNNSKK